MMLGNYNENVGMAKVLARRKQRAEESANNDYCHHSLNSSLTRLFDVPTLNLDANDCYELTDFDSYQQQPPATANLATTSSNCKPGNNLEQLFKAASLAAKNSHSFHLVLYYVIVKSVLTPPSLYMVQFFRV